MKVIRLLFYSCSFWFLVGCSGGLNTGNPDSPNVNARDGSQDVEFGEIGAGDCNDEVLMCPDGSTVERDPDLDCEFPDCPEED